MKKLLISGSLLNQNMNNVLARQFGFFDNNKIYIVEIDEIGEYSEIQTEVKVSEYSVLGEFLNDDSFLRNHPLYPFKPTSLYRVRESLRGKEIEEIPGGTRERSFGH